MKIADYRIQTSTPNAPEAGVMGCFANASGQLITIGSDSVTRAVGNWFTGSYATGVAMTGTLVSTGIVFGNAATNSILLANPYTFLSVMGPNSENLLVPAYRIKTT